MCVRAWSLGVMPAIHFFIINATFALAQDGYVIDSAFCKSVTKMRCVEPVAAGQSIDISELTADKNGPLIYFWGKIRNPSERVVAVLIARQGECYSEKLILPGKKPSALTTTLAFFSSLSLADVIGKAGIKEAKVSTPSGSPVDVRFTVASIAPSEGYRTFGFRNVPCGGVVHAVLTDGNSNQLPPHGRNNVKSITITNNE